MLYDLNEALLGQRPEDIQSTTLASFVSRKMLIDIVSGELPPGRELGTMSLKTRYGIKSQSPIRQALWLLSDSGFVVPRGERRGYNVAPLSFEEFEDIVRASCKLEEVGLRASIQQGGEAWENRVLIAEYRLEKALHTESRPTIDDVLEREALHGEFHRTLISDCGSRWLIDRCAELHLRRFRYRYLLNYRRRQNGLPEGEHSKICRAALTRDGDQAVTLLCSHYETALKVARIALACGINPSDH